MSDSLQPYGLQPARLLCLWDSQGKNIGVRCHALLQGIFPTQGLNPTSLMSPALTGRFFTTSTTWEAPDSVHYSVIHCLSMYDLITIAVKAVLRFLLL